MLKIAGILILLLGLGVWSLFRLLEYQENLLFKKNCKYIKKSQDGIDYHVLNPIWNDK